MRTIVVVLVQEAIKGVLLTARVALGRLQRGLLERRVHPLVPSIILRRSRTRALGHDTQLYPAHRNAAQPARRAAGEGNAVVGMDH